MAEDSGTQPPATFSSFINKNTTGKKFAPKAARRRPAAKPAGTESTPTAKPAGTEPVLAVQSEPETANGPAESTPSASGTASTTASAAAPLPTPATQHDVTSTPDPAPVPAPAAQAPQPPPESQHGPPPATPRVVVPPSTPQIAAPPPTSQIAAPPPTSQIAAPPPISQIAAPPPTPQAAAPPSVDDDIEAGRSPKRRRIESPPRQSTPLVPVAVMLPPQDAPTGETGPQQPALTPSAELGESSASTGVTPPTHPEDPAPKRRRRTLPWAAVNHPQEEGAEASASGPPAKKKRAPPKPRGKKKTAEVEDEEPQQTADGEEAASTQKPTSARARGKRRTAAPEIGEDGQPVEPAPKKPRKPRKDKGKQPAVEGEGGQESEPVEGEEGHVAAKPKPKPRAPKRKKSTPAEGEEGSVEPKKRGRPPREDTPPEAEDHVIDPDAMCMDDLASRNIRVGKLSRREKEMRKIDWEAVKQRRREEDARHITTKEAQAAVDKLLESGEAEQVSTGPRYHVVDGRIELVQDSGTIDRERDADREIEMMTITEEDDLTTRITSRSFMKNNKRFPNEFVLPGQGKRWNAQSTDIFYQGLRSFGTDFQMIAHMFPGMTRRSIKTKFTREERENPDIVRDCLRGESTLASHWGDFLEASQLQDDSFADSDRIKRELEEEEARMREQINDALKEKQEREHQKRLAGVADDGDANEKDTGKKKKRKKDKNVTFHEEGVEILGELDDDPNWGQE